MIGTVLKHRYVVREKIGEGSLFTVYKCEDKINNTSVAAKILLPQYAANCAFGDRVASEAQAMIGVSHPGIVEVLDCGSQDGTYFVITEFVRGVDLAERIRRSAPFTLSTVVEIGLAICDVLDYAHSRGFIHGDLRPGNVLVTPSGQIKIADFWVAGAVAASQSVRANAMMKSVHYMSPEMAEGKTPTPSSDLYSLGVILFELLTGKVPYDADTPIAIALKHAREPIPAIRAINPGVPKNLELLAGKALQKAPENRFRSAKAMRAELRNVNDALNLSKPLVWSQVGGQKTPATIPDADDDDSDTPSALMSVVKYLIIALLVVIVMGGVGLGAYMFTKPKDMTLPELVGKTYEDAQRTASDLDLRLTVQTDEYNEKFPAGVIYFASPGGGSSVRRGDQIKIWLSKGSRYALVPNVVGTNLEDAKQRIADAGLNVGEITEDYSPTVPALNIMKQTPEPGAKLERGQPLNLVSSLGPKPSESDNPTGDETTVDSTSGKTRTFDIEFDVPAARKDEKVEIRVSDDNGENVVYSRFKHPGDHVKQTIEAVGSDVTIRVYVDDKLIEEEHK